MKTIVPRVLYALTFIVLLLGGAQLNPSMAQNPTPSPQAAPPASMWLSITSVRVKPEMMEEFQNFMKNTTNPALRKGGLKWREVWQSTLAAGDNFEFVIVAPMDKFADFDSPGALEKALGSAGFAAWQAKAGSFVTSVHRYIIRTRPDLSTMGQRTGPPKLAVVSTVHVAINRNADFENYAKNDYVPVMAKGGATYLVSQTVFGGDVNEYVTLTLRESFAEIDKGPVPVQVLGAEAAQKLLEKLPAGAVTHIERSIVRFVPELSLAPAEAPK
jgi:hypothetical protein